MRFKMIFFDFDGTLVNTLPDIALSVNTVLNRHGFDQIAEKIIQSYIGEGSCDLIKKCLKLLNIDMGKYGEIHREFLEYYAENSSIKSYLYEDVKETLEKIDCKKSIYTNKPLKITYKISEKFFLKSLFDEIISPEVYGVKKPDPLAVIKISEKYGLNFNEILLVGDSKYDIKCSKNAGIKNCIVTYGYGQLDEIKNADILIDKFSEIINIL